MEKITGEIFVLIEMEVTSSLVGGGGLLFLFFCCFSFDIYTGVI